MQQLPVSTTHVSTGSLLGIRWADRARLETLQVNLGYRCNQQCLHCHVNAGPRRKESMDLETVEQVRAFARHAAITTLDLAGGAPELNPHVCYLVQATRSMDIEVIDRCNLTILEEPGHEDLAEFLAAQRVRITALLPCYLEDNVESQRGKGVFGISIRALQRLNGLGYGVAETGLLLDLVYNPPGPVLPPPQIGRRRTHLTELMQRPVEGASIVIADHWMPRPELANESASRRNAT